MSTQNLIMVDFASKHPGSVAAMLKGEGDGREKKYQAFVDAECMKEPILDDADLAEIYSRQCRAEFNRGDHEKKDTKVESKLGSLFKRIFAIS